MDLSLLPDDLILKILSLLPSSFTVTTSLLSKRWCSLWKHVPTLVYADQYIDNEHWRASRFVDKFLLLRDNAHASLETMHLYVGQNCPPTDIDTWVRIAVSRGVRDLLFYQYSTWFLPIRFPKSLYTCGTLVTLSLQQAFIVDVPLNICFPSLKSLSLIIVYFPNDETLHHLLSGCRVLEDLTVVRCDHDVKTFKIMVPTLQSLRVDQVFINGNPVTGPDAGGFVIEAPRLKSLEITSQFGWFHSLVKMPYLVKAYINLQHGDSKNLLGCVTSAKHLLLCVKKTMGSYPIGDFNQLVSLKVCTCSLELYRLILTRAPKLRVLRFHGQADLLPSSYIYDLKKYCYSSSEDDVQTQWERPSSVPECLVSSLEYIEWIDNEGTEAEHSEAKYLMENSEKLKTMSFTRHGDVLYTTRV